MARSVSTKHTPRRLEPPHLPETVVEARALALGLPRFAIRLAGWKRLKHTPSAWPRRPAE